uniref:Cytochrome b5 heme-binding domain-containing protein n=1 Tax=Panagrolaimus sp. JU765 TaxID=591449 RepID=A0AC34R1Y4_9BILA
MGSDNDSLKELDPLFVYYNEKLYNVAKFADKHPGGRKLLEKVAGGDIDDFMNGKQRILSVRHKHSENAYKMLERYSMDKDFQEDPLIASGKPILFEVGKLKHKYWQWIHLPYDGRVRLFECDLFERMTNTKWYVIPMIWMPLVIYFSMIGLQLFQNAYGIKHGTYYATFFFILGSLFWTFTEYCLHRFAFHWKPNMDSEYQ